MNEPWNEFYARCRIEIVWPLFENERDAYLHAIGSISQNWNTLEETFYTFLVFSEIPDGVARYLGYKMNNNDKMEVMSILASEFETSNPESYRLARVFFKFARVCAGNRNYLMHAQLSSISDGVCKLQKPSRRSVGQTVSIEITVRELHAMSQCMKNTMQFGARLQAVMLHFPSGYSQSADGSLMHWRLLDPPSEPVSWESYVV